MLLRRSPSLILNNASSPSGVMFTSSALEISERRFIWLDSGIPLKRNFTQREFNGSIILGELGEMEGGRGRMGFYGMAYLLM
jgi:hypothetical protein